jgi:mannose-6-phosphate isomerase-like protein (cupin superfamily)
MKILAGGCRIFDPEDGCPATCGNWASIFRIGKATGAKQVSQTINRYATGRSATVRNPSSEEVLYVVEGAGLCYIDGSPYPLAPQTGVFIPAGAECSIENREITPLVIVSACCPEDPDRTIQDEPSVVSAGERSKLTVREFDREKLPATSGREFCLMVDKDLGCKQVTQFVGWIPPSSAPFHYHTYEEVIFILEGHGTLHVEDDVCPFSAGSSIYLAPEVRHRLENPGPSSMRVLGVFSPSGSPAAAYQ